MHLIETIHKQDLIICCLNGQLSYLSKKLIYSDNEEHIYGSLDFDDRYIKAGIGWDANQLKIGGTNP